MTMGDGSSVTELLPPEMVSFHDTGKSLAFADSADINFLAGLKQIHPEFLPYLVALGLVQPKLPERTLWLDLDLVEKAFKGFGQLARLRRAIAEKNGGVSVLFGGTNGNHRTWTGHDSRNRHSLSLFVKNLGHANLFPQYSYTHLFLSFYTLI